MRDVELKKVTKFQKNKIKIKVSKGSKGLIWIYYVQTKLFARRSGVRGVAAWVSREKQQKRERGGGMCEKKDREKRMCVRDSWRENT